MAEVLITLAIIGVVAALTIPSLVTKINDKVVEHQTKVMRGKIVQGLNLLNSQENGLTKSYANSEEFVRALSKYMKMSTICSANNLKDCLGYDKVNYDKDGETKDKELSSITTASALQLEDGFLDPAGFVMGDGTPIIVSWNSNCTNGTQTDEDGNAIILDPDQPLKEIPTKCFDGLYDINGTRKPNMFGSEKDLRSFLAAKIGDTHLGTLIPELGYYVYNLGRQSVDSYIDTTKDNPYDSRCKDSSVRSCTQNRWAGAKETCEKLGMELPDKDTLKNDIYPLKSKYTEAIPQSGWVWSSSEHENIVHGAYSINFDNGGTYSYPKDNLKYVLCVGN